jgi:hypothetical protein
MKFEVRLSFSIRRDQAAERETPELRDSSTDALVERADEISSPELHKQFREPPWEDRQRIGFRPNNRDW